MMAAYRTETIRISKIGVNTENVRFAVPAENQTDAIRKIIQDQGKKFVNLTKHISKKGLEPGRTIYVHEVEKDQYVALDGNRRLSAIKVLSSFELQEEFKALLPKNFKNIAKEFISNYCTRRKLA